VIEPRRPLHIVHFVTEDYGPDVANGVTKSIYHLNRTVAGLGHDVRVVGRDRQHMQTPRGFSRWAENVTRRVGRSICHVPAALRSTLLEMQPDFVHLHSIHIPENVGVAAALVDAGIPYCVTVNGGLSPVARRRRRLRKWTFRVLWEQRYLDKAGFVHAVSELEERELRDYGVRAPIVVAPNGVDTDAMTRADDPRALWTRAPQLEGRRIFMFAGRLDPNQKGLDLLIDGFAASGVHDAALVLVGPDWKDGQASLQRRAARSGVADRIVFLGPAYGIEQANLIAAADVFVHTSRWEGLSLAVLEAAAWRKPCLLTPAADPMNQLGGHRAAVVVAPEVGSISTGLREMASLSKAQLRDMGDRAHHVVASTFTWKHSATKLIDAYRQFRTTGGPLYVSEHGRQPVEGVR
jgi:glycosyltransferase involved in cell wall biosynthesis